MRFEEQYRSRNILAKLVQISVGLLGMFALVGCESLSSPIKGEDKSVFQKAVRVNLNLDDGDSIESVPRSGQAIEIGYQKTRISSDQILVAGQPPVYLNNTTIMSPNQLRNIFDFSCAEVSWRWRHFEDRPVGTDILLGIASPSLALTVSTPTQSAYENFNTTGPQVGVGLIARASHRSSIYARASLFASSGIGVQSITKRELYYTYALQKYLSLHFGYADWTISGPDVFLRSPGFRLRFAGPVLMLNWNFYVGK